MMSKTLPLSIILIAIVALTACKTWYKTGAEGDELTRDQQRCENETGASAGKVFEECMAQAGWRHSSSSATTTEAESIRAQDAAVEATSPTAPKTPAQPRQVGGWIQIGEHTRPLADAKAECIAAGVDSKTFSECMQGQGWRPVGIRISVEEPGDVD